MKNITALILTLFASNIFSEELSNISNEEIWDAITVWTPQGNIPSFVRGATAAGVGVFINVPSPTNPVVDIEVQNWWTTNPSTNNALRIYSIDDWGETNWIFPTNVPVVFFANAASNVVINTCIGEDIVARMSQTEREQLIFPLADRSWFRVSRDNGLMYEFTTNLWQHMRVNPNTTNQYELLRDSYRDITPEQSWRVIADADAGIDALFQTVPEVFLVEKRNDPLLHTDQRDTAVSVLINRHGWEWGKDGVLHAPDRTAINDMFIAASNFTAQALAVWKTHDTARIVSFAQTAVATNATPTSLLFRGIVAYYLEDDFATTTNLIHSASILLRENRAYSFNQKGVFHIATDLLCEMHLRPEVIQTFDKNYNFEGKPLKHFVEEHFSNINIFEKFSGEFPFSNTLKLLSSND